MARRLGGREKHKRKGNIGETSRRKLITSRKVKSLSSLEDLLQDSVLPLSQSKGAQTKRKRRMISIVYAQSALGKSEFRVMPGSVI